MSKRVELTRIMGDLCYQHSLGVHTYSPCPHTGCENIARGGHPCSDCLEAEIDELVGIDGVGERLSARYMAYLETREELLSYAETL